MQQLSKPTYSEQVVSLIRQRIRSGKLCGGDKLSEAALAEECGISRAPVREALCLLEADGYIMSHPKRGKCITLLTGDDIRHRYELCGLLEGAATANVAATQGDDLLEDLETLLERMRAGMGQGTGRAGGQGTAQAYETQSDLGTAFHEAILQRVSNPFLTAVARRSCRVISKYLMYQQWRTLYSPEELYQRHYSIYEALRTRDARRIEDAVRAHYADSAERLARLCEAGPRCAAQPERRRAHFPAE